MSHLTGARAFNDELDVVTNGQISSVADWTFKCACGPGLPVCDGHFWHRLREVVQRSVVERECKPIERRST